MNIALTPPQERFVRQQLESGKYQSADEVVAEAFHLLQERDKQTQTQQMAAVDLSQFAGRIQLTEDPLQFQQRIRHEW